MNIKFASRKNKSQLPKFIDGMNIHGDQGREKAKVTEATIAMILESLTA